MFRGEMSTYSPTMFNICQSSLILPLSLCHIRGHVIKSSQWLPNSVTTHGMALSKHFLYLYYTFIFLNFDTRIPKSPTRKYFVPLILVQFLYGYITPTLRSGSNALCSRQLTCCVSVVSRQLVSCFGTVSALL